MALEIWTRQRNCWTFGKLHEDDIR